MDQLRTPQYNAHAPPAQQPHKLALELDGEVRDVLPRVLADDEHLPEVGLGLGMALEAVLVAALLLADLTVPAQPLQALRLHLVGDIFRGSDFRARHLGLSNECRGGAGACR